MAADAVGPPDGSSEEKADKQKAAGGSATPPPLSLSDPPLNRHIRAIPLWWWLMKPRTAFKTLLAMKEAASRRVPPVRPPLAYKQGYSGSLTDDLEAGTSKLKLQDGINLPLVGDIKWSEIWAYSLEWISNPLNIALSFWCILCIVPSVIILAVESGALDHWLTDEFIREEWVEISNQVLNALFVLMCLIWHPVFFRLSYQLYRWSPDDIRQLRGEYCRGGTRKPDEWWHISVIVFWFHTTCVATYALAAVYWFYNRFDRPTAAVLITVTVSFGSPIIAFTYNIFSPLGRDFYLEVDDDLEQQQRTGSELFKESKPNFYLSQKVVPYPEWRGRILADCFQKPRLALLTVLFPFCVFGINMERLGFGQRWVQSASFVLIVVGPCLVFEISAHTVRFYTIQQSMIYIGLCLAVLGLLYGAYWRMQMRRKFRLPAYRWCFGIASLTDAMIWIFCCCCAICQEVRTAEYYDIGDNAFFEKSDEERRKIAEGEGLKAVGLGDASKRVARIGEGLKEGLEDAGKGVVRILTRVGGGLTSKDSSSSLSEEAEDAGASSSTSPPEPSPQDPMAPPKTLSMDTGKGKD